MATATFISRDTTTQGNWVSAYGSDGWFLEGDSPQSSYPGYTTTPSFSGWSGPFDAGANTDSRALQKASNHAVRNDSVLYTNTTATIDFTITGTKKISFYVWAGDSSSSQSVSVLDMDNAGATLDTQTISDNFTNGTYLSWYVSGHVRLSVTKTSGTNGARVSGLFFDPATAVIASLSPTAIIPGESRTITVTGAGTSFVNGTTTVSVSGTGITVGSVAVSSGTSLTVALTASTSATLGSRTVTVTTGAEAPTKSLSVGAAYWRLRVTQAGVWSLAEWRFYDASSTEISRTGGTATASSTNFGSPSSVFDNNASTWWASNASTSSLTYQFSSAIAPSYFTLQNRPDSDPEQVPTDLAFQFSTDGATWFDYYLYYGVRWSSTLGTVITFDSAHAAPTTIGISWRLLITADSASQSTTIIALSLLDSGASPISVSRYAAITSSTLIETVPSSGMSVFDGDSSTYWASSAAPSSGSPQWIGCRFSDPTVYPASFQITPRSGSFAQAPSAFKLQSSTDEVTWTDVQSYTATWSSSSPQTFTVSSAPAAASRLCFFILM